ncbi:MAG: hypothetical protein ACT4QF_09345 [Sporichthyaceae bacterium]
MADIVWRHRDHDCTANPTLEVRMSGPSINGEFSICHATLIEDSDSFNYKTLSWNYDDAEEALAKLATVAQEHGVDPADCVVVHVIEPQG